MAFRLEDFKKVARKSAGSATAAIYPHQIKDRKMPARIEMAIRSYDNLVGRPRKEMDAGAMVYFLGDHRVARGIVACLGQTYRYETLPVARVAGRHTERLLSESGLRTPPDFRAKTYEHLNTHAGGWVSEAERLARYREIAAPFDCTPETWDALMHLDAEENQVLTRSGEMPEPADIVAQYNYHSVDTVLRRGTKIVLQELSVSSAQVSDVRSLAAAYGCRAAFSSGNSTLTLTDLEMSSLLPRRAGRLARCLLLMLHGSDVVITTGYTEAQIGAKKFRLALSPEILRMLRGCADPDGAISLKAHSAAVASLHKDLLKLRVKGEAAGWRYKRDPDPIVTGAGLWLPDLLLSRGKKQVAVAIGGQRPDLWPLPMLRLKADNADATDVLAQAGALIAPRPEPAMTLELRFDEGRQGRLWMDEELLVAAA